MTWNSRLLVSLVCEVEFSEFLSSEGVVRAGESIVSVECLHGSA